MKIHLTELLACPKCANKLNYQGTNLELNIQDGKLTCEGCEAVWETVEGIPHLLDSPTGTAPSAMNRISGIFHKPMVRWGLPIIQGGGGMCAVRTATIKKLDLGSIQSTEDSPARILEVGFATGSNLSRVRNNIPANIDVEVWGLDSNVGLMAHAQKGFETPDFEQPANLVGADPQHMPFPDSTFDRVFHIGGLAQFSDPDAVLAEMIRVAKPNAPVVVVGKRLAPESKNSPVFGATFKLYSGAGGDPDNLLHQLPDDTQHAAEEQLSRFYYCLSFSAPKEASA